MAVAMTLLATWGPADNFHATFVFHVNGHGEQTQSSTESDCNG